jgi:phage baseplate assembly protein W
MPLERDYKNFLDLSMTFQSNPLNSDLIALKNQTAIARSVRNLILTARGERFYDELKGSRLSRLLFENFDSVTADIIEDEIRNVIEQNEPRAEILEIRVKPSYDTYEYHITIIYSIQGLDASPTSLTFALNSVR